MNIYYTRTIKENVNFTPEEIKQIKKTQAILKKKGFNLSLYK